MKSYIYFRLIIVYTLLLTLGSCKNDKCDQVHLYDDVDIKLSSERLEDQLMAISNSVEMAQFLVDNRTFADYFLDAKQYPHDTILAKRMFRLFAQSSIDTLIDETKSYFNEFDVNMEEFETAYRFIKYHYPETKLPKVKTVMTGFYNDMYISDSLIVLGLDYFVGMNGSYHPNDIPMYIVKRYMKESMVPITLSFISNGYSKTDQTHGTLLADMVNLGKSYYFVSSALPCKADSLIIGYTAEEMRLVQENQEVIWANLIENELLYETSHFLKNKFIGESPNVVEISEKCPGRVGAWIGWEIVRKYMEKNPDISFVDLMNETDAHKIFQQSGYRPRNEPS